MIMLSTSVVTILLFLSSLSNAKVDTCITCTSDSINSENVECENMPETQPNGACSAEFGNDYCYVLVTRQKQPVEGWMWNSKLTS